MSQTFCDRVIAATEAREAVLTALLKAHIQQMRDEMREGN